MRQCWSVMHYVLLVSCTKQALYHDVPEKSHFWGRLAKCRIYINSKFHTFSQILVYKSASGLMVKCLLAMQTLRVRFPARAEKYLFFYIFATRFCQCMQELIHLFFPFLQNKRGGGERAFCKFGKLTRCRYHAVHSRVPFK